MSEPRVLYLIIDGLPNGSRREVERLAARPGVATEIFPLTESSAPAALEKIFNADTVKVWGPL